MTNPTNNKSILAWIEENVALCRPDKVVWIDGTGKLRNRSYDFNDQEIKVLYKDGRCLPISEASDQLDRHFLEKQVTKYYMYYPKDQK